MRVLAPAAYRIVVALEHAAVPLQPASHFVPEPVLLLFACMGPCSYNLEGAAQSPLLVEGMMNALEEFGVEVGVGAALAETGRLTAQADVESWPRLCQRLPSRGEQVRMQHAERMPERQRDEETAMWTAKQRDWFHADAAARVEA